MEVRRVLPGNRAYVFSCLYQHISSSGTWDGLNFFGKTHPILSRIWLRAITSTPHQDGSPNGQQRAARQFEQEEGSQTNFEGEAHEEAGQES
jgi:hypothetical protein